MVKDLIAAGKLKEALDQLYKETKSSEVVLIAGRLKTLGQQELMGILPFSEANIERNRIRNAVLSLIDETQVIEQPKKEEKMNPTAKFNSAFDTLKTCLRDREFNVDAIHESIVYLDNEFGLPEIMEAADRFQGRNFQSLGAAVQNSQIKSFLEEIIAFEPTLRLSLESALAATESLPDWEEALDLLMAKPSYQKWQNLVSAVTLRLRGSMFNQDLRGTWDKMVQNVDSNLENNLTWGFQFRRLYSHDINNWVSKNLKV